MAHDEARFEYRVFASGLGAVPRRMRLSGSEPLVRQSQELYLLGRRDELYNVKIRDGQLDIKVLVNCVTGLEQWDPREKIPFPLSGQALDEVLAPALGLGLGLKQVLPAGAGISPDALAAALSARPGVSVVPVRKRRFGYLIDGCIVEHAEVYLAGAEIQTACAESIDAKLVRKIVSRLGLEAWPNTSYVAAIRRREGMF